MKSFLFVNKKGGGNSIIYKIQENRICPLDSHVKLVPFAASKSSDST